MHIALDAMGGDHGPEELIAGALLAAEQSDIHISLVGDEVLLQSHLAKVAPDSSIASRIEIVHSSQVVEMKDNPVDAMRKKKDSSIMVAFDLVGQGKADAVVSAGNSGATMAAAVRKLGRLKGVSRPGIASFFPTLKKPVVMMDIGANVECRPQHLFQFAIMASAFSKIHNNSSPRVGILTIGEESGKGNTLVKETYDLLENSSLNFIGNVEGRDVYKGEVDVIVCDGFVGNICLKISEGLVEVAMKMLRDEIVKSIPAKIGYLLARPAFRAFKKRVDYSTYGGAPLLGVNGIGMICHGKSDRKTIRNAICEAAKMVNNNVNQEISRGIAVESATAQSEE
ncbi:phosphate acyltransferase PlsX [Desulfosediminicola ganghwensis]|uniref:phosphate acyltransferase PlsX n=1 Tax=Desulfosediminicola ganghwensis TaxID=2569540 RepID=UPI0010AD1EBD|nr:phosphate acyltransferase PlsX [Desulfosediminicola ganghwensis]